MENILRCLLMPSDNKRHKKALSSLDLGFASRTPGYCLDRPRASARAQKSDEIFYSRYDDKPV
jgi:hypothetical protein